MKAQEKVDAIQAENEQLKSALTNARGEIAALAASGRN
jgi:hypothetical protein